MKIIKIGALWCPGCLVMKKIWNNINNKYNLEIVDLDYDMDNNEVIKYNVGQILPVIIFISSKGEEIDRLVGEAREDEIINLIEKYKVM